MRRQPSAITQHRGRTLFAAAGLQLTADVPTSAGVHVLETRAVV